MVGRPQLHASLKSLWDAGDLVSETNLIFIIKCLFFLIMHKDA